MRPRGSDIHHPNENKEMVISPVQLRPYKYAGDDCLTFI